MEEEREMSLARAGAKPLCPAQIQGHQVLGKFTNEMKSLNPSASSAAHGISVRAGACGFHAAGTHCAPPAARRVRGAERQF